MKIIARALSKLLLLIGALIFFFGDRALQQIWKVSFVTSLLAAIGGGVAIMFAGAAIQLALTKAERKSSGARGA